MGEGRSVYRVLGWEALKEDLGIGGRIKVRRTLGR
jgi:hypothetical protein